MTTILSLLVILTIILNLSAVNSSKVLVVLVDFGTSENPWTIPFRESHTPNFFPRELNTGGAVSPTLPDIRFDPIARLNDYFSVLSFGQMQLDGHYERISMNVSHELTISPQIVLEGVPDVIVERDYDFMVIVVPLQAQMSQPYELLSGNILFLNGFHFLRESDHFGDGISLKVAFSKMLGLKDSFLSSQSASSSSTLDMLDVSSAIGDIGHAFTNPFSLIDLGFISLDDNLTRVSGTGVYEIQGIFPGFDKSVSFPFSSKYSLEYSAESSENSFGLFFPSSSSSSQSPKEEGYIVWKRLEKTYSATQVFDLTERLVIHRLIDGQLSLYHPFHQEAEIDEHSFQTGFPGIGESFLVEGCLIQLLGELSLNSTLSSHSNISLISVDCDTFEEKITKVEFFPALVSDVLDLNSIVPDIYVEHTHSSAGFLALSRSSDGCSGSMNKTLALISTPIDNMYLSQHSSDTEWVWSVFQDFDELVLCWSDSASGPFFEQALIPSFILKPKQTPSSSFSPPIGCLSDSAGGQCYNGCPSCAIQDVVCYDAGDEYSCYCIPGTTSEGDIPVSDLCCQQGQVTGWDSSSDSFQCSTTDDSNSNTTKKSVQMNIHNGWLYVSLPLEEGEVLQGSVHMHCKEGNSSYTVISDVLQDQSSASFLNYSIDSELETDILECEFISLGENSLAQVANQTVLLQTETGRERAASSLRATGYSNNSLSLFWRPASGVISSTLEWYRTDTPHNISYVSLERAFEWTIDNLRDQTEYKFQITSISLNSELNSGLNLISNPLTISVAEIASSDSEQACFQGGVECSGNGVCSSLSVCVCEYDFHGDFCQLSGCQLDTQEECSGIGSCISGEFSDTCACPNGYIGQFCERPDYFSQSMNISSPSDYFLKQETFDVKLRTLTSHDISVYFRVSEADQVASDFSFEQDQWSFLGEFNVSSLELSSFEFSHLTEKSVSLLIRDGYYHGFSGLVAVHGIDPFVSVDGEDTPSEREQGTLEKRDIGEFLFSTKFLPYMVSLVMGVMVISTAGVVLLAPRWFRQRNADKLKRRHLESERVTLSLNQNTCNNSLEKVKGQVKVKTPKCFEEPDLEANNLQPGA